MINKAFRQLRYFCSLLFLWLISCASQKSLTIDSVTPTISIDSVFTSVKINRGFEHAKRLTKATSNLLDSAAKNGAFLYVPNYTLERKIPSTYCFSVILTPAQTQKTTKDTIRYLVPAFRGSLFDNIAKVKSNDMTMYGTNAKDSRILMYNTALPDSTDYKELSSLMSFGSRLQYLVPFKSILLPIKQNDIKLKSFSIDRYLVSSNKENKTISKQLTHLLNNILVFNQPNYTKYVFKNYTNYNYYNNYFIKRRLRTKTDFQIHAVLTEDVDNFTIDFKLYGKDVNLVMMEDRGISTKIVLNKKRLLEKDYSEAMFQIQTVVPSLIIVNTMF